MGTATLTPKLFPGSGSRPQPDVTTDLGARLKPPSHIARWVGISLTIVAAAIGLWLYSTYMANRAAVAAAEFDEFRAAYAEQCNVPTYAGPVPDSVRDLVISSPIIRAEVAKQLASLRAGSSCHEVGEALRAVDLVVPRPGLVP